MGTIGSFFCCLGDMCAACAYATGAALGPMTCLQASGTILIAILEALWELKLPNYMQLIGLFIGIVGTMILSMPDQMYNCWQRITLQNK